jgi:stage IV sporulation protein FB
MINFLKKLSRNIKTKIKNVLKKLDRFPFVLKMKVKNLEVKFNILFFVLFLLPLYTFKLLDGIIISSFLIITILLHEAAHAFVAIKNKINVQRVFFTYWGGAIVVDFKDLINNNIKAIKIIFAGPLSSLLFSLIVCVICLFVGLESYLSYMLFMIGVFVGLTNLIPMIPVDGGLLLYFILRKKFSVKVSKIISICSSIICGVGIIAYLLFILIQGEFLFSSMLFFSLVFFVLSSLILLFVKITRNFFKEVDECKEKENLK